MYLTGFYIKTWRKSCWLLLGQASQRTGLQADGSSNELAFKRTSLPADWYPNRRAYKAGWVMYIKRESRTIQFIRENLHRIGGKLAIIKDKTLWHFEVWYVGWFPPHTYKILFASSMVTWTTNNGDLPWWKAHCETWRITRRDYRKVYLWLVISCTDLCNHSETLHCWLIPPK